MYQDPERYARASIHKPCGSNRLLRLTGKTRMPQRRDLRVRILQQPFKKEAITHRLTSLMRMSERFRHSTSIHPMFRNCFGTKRKRAIKKQTQHRFATGSHTDTELSCYDRSKMRNKFKLSDVYTHTCQSRLGAMLTRKATLKCGRSVDKI